MLMLPTFSFMCEQVFSFCACIFKTCVSFLLLSCDYFNSLYLYFALLQLKDADANKYLHNVG